MANGNKTVKQIAKEMQNDWAQLYFANGTRKANGDYSDVSCIETKKFAKRILAAHNNEMGAKDSEIENLKRHLREAVASQCSCKFKCYWYDSENNKCNRNDPKNPCCVWPSRVALGEGVVNGK